MAARPRVLLFSHGEAVADHVCRSTSGACARTSMFWSETSSTLSLSSAAEETRSEFGVASLLGKPQERGRLPEKIALARHSKHSRLQAVRNSDSVPWRKYENTYKASFVLARMPPGGAPATNSSIRP